MAGERISDDALIAELERVKAIAPRMRKEDIEQIAVHSWATFAKRFRTIHGMRKAAGWVPPEPADNPLLLMLQGWSENRCVKFLRDIRWPAGVACPRCNERDGVTTLKNQRLTNPEIALYECLDCRYQFSDISQTFVHKTPGAIKPWFVALVMFAAGIKPRDVGIEHAWYTPRAKRIKDSVFARDLAAALAAALKVEASFSEDQRKLLINIL